MTSWLGLPLHRFRRRRHRADGRDTAPPDGRVPPLPPPPHLGLERKTSMPLDALSQELDPYSTQVVHAFDSVGPAVVHVTAFTRDGRPAGQGSGVIFTPDGYVLTNSHVVGGAARLQASLTDGQSFEAALVGDDPATDIAVLRLSGAGLPHAELGVSASLRVGQMVVAI